ncbi:MAG: hypothetical protein EBY97_06300, partial [Burkholderiaceae bacterium]|nr:hypothetical protein [Burkholderiaceae bacterium]
MDCSSTAKEKYMGLSSLFHTSANALSKQSMIGMMALALALPLSTSFVNAAPVNVNTASQTELESIRGLGPSKAKAIIAEREKGGAFYDSYDLQSRVRGIGERSVGKLMENGLKIEGGDKLGRTIIFAVNQEHAKFIVQCFEKRYPEQPAGFIAMIHNAISHAQSLIDSFCDKYKENNSE